MHRSVTVLVLISLLVGMTGCLEFDAQEIHIRYDRKKDRLDALVIYRGLYSDADDPKKAIEDFTEMTSGARRVYFASNWPFGVDLDELAKSDSKLGRVLAAQTTLRSSPGWKDGEGRLCGHQFVRVTQVSEVLAAANIEFAKNLQSDEHLREFAGENADPDSLQLLRVAATSARPRFFAFRGSAFTFNVPLSDVGARQFRLRLVEAASDALGKDRTDAEKAKEAEFLAEMLARNDLGIERVGNNLTFVLGNPSRQKILFEVTSKGEYKDNLEAALKAKGLGIDPDGSLAAARKAFAEFCAEK
jgi:hypothetical protein